MDEVTVAAAKTPAEEMLTKSGLKARGWTDTGIAQFLGAPDATKPNPKYRSAAPMLLFLLTRVEAAETTSGYRLWRAASDRRRESAGVAVAGRKARLLATIEVWQPSVPLLNEEEVRRMAVANYNEIQGLRDSWNRAPEWSPAMETTDRRFLDRITVNYLRHVRTNYDELLASLHGKVGIEEAKELVREQVYEAIAEAYPDLAPECSRQERARADADSTREGQPPEAT